jgi:hypothetical protein
VKRKRKLSAVFLQPIQNPSYIHTHINKVQLLRVKMICVAVIRVTWYMCRVRQINDPVLSSLKMEGISCMYFFGQIPSQNLVLQCPDTHKNLDFLIRDVALLSTRVLRSTSRNLCV